MVSGVSDIFDNRHACLPISAASRAMRGTGEDARELVGETERLPPRDPRFIASFFRLIVPPVGGVVDSPHFPVRRCVTSLVSICRIDVQRRHLALLIRV